MIYTSKQYHRERRRIIRLFAARKSFQRELSRTFDQEHTNRTMAEIDQYICQQRDLLAQFENSWRAGYEFPELPDLSNLGKKLILGRLALGMSRSELAERSGTSRQQIRRYEQQFYEQASLRLLVQVREALQTKITDRNS